MPWMSWLASHGYYRVSVGGAEPPREGPALVVANHTNALLDTAFVVLASQRRVRFMAKAPLFTYPGLGWLVKAVGSVPVYRRQDDPKLVAQNLDVFREVYRAIADGFAVGIFPEGTSHSASHLQPLKSGAARIALGAAEQYGKAFPIIPIGMMFMDRRTFRSKARVVVGQSCMWDDLVGCGPRDREAVRELTRRIEVSMRAVTLNLHDWNDQTLVRAAEEVWCAEFGGATDDRAQIARLGATTHALARLRLRDHSGWRTAARELRAHDRVLGRLGITPSTLRAETSSRGAVLWLMRKLPMLLLTPIALAGLLLLWIPREVTGTIATKASKKEGDDSVPTFRVLYGGVFFFIWFVLLSGAVGATWGWLAALGTFVAMPFLAFGAMRVGESHRFVWQAIRRYFVVRKHAERVVALRQRQHQLAQKLKDLLREASE